MTILESWPRGRKIGAVCVALAVLGAISVGVRLSAEPRASFYLVIGASDAKGFEPTGTMGSRGPNEAATKNGYASDVAKLLDEKGSPLTLVNIACPGETVQSLVNGGDACSPSVSLLSRAEGFLRQRRGASGLVTVDVGFNDIRPCLQFSEVDQDCVNSSVALVRKYLPRALAGMERAAGPNVTFVGVLYGDPFLGHYLDSSLGPSNARATLRAMKALDAALDAAFRASKVAVAPVETALDMSDSRLTGRFDGRVLPQNVATACKTTWMCRTAPWGPNDHPDNEGYSVIARAIVSVVPASL